MRAKTLVDSFRYALSGLFYTFSSQRNFRIHTVALLILAMLVIILEFSVTEAMLLFAAAFSVLICELFNTAIEKTIDLYTSRIHPLAKIAKNCAAGAVLLSAVFAVLTALLLVVPRLVQIVR